MKILGICILVFFYSCGVCAIENKNDISCFKNGFEFIKSNSNTFPSGSIVPVRSLDNGDVIALRINKLSPESILRKYNIGVGERIVEVCGITVKNLFAKDSNKLKCCASEYPVVLTIKISKSLLETYVVNIKQ